MDDTLFKIILLIVVVVCTIVSSYVVPYVKTLIGENTLSEISKWTTFAVKAAEMLFTGTGQGEAKKQYVVEFLDNLFNKNKQTITEDQLNVLVEAAVKELHIEEGVAKTA